MTDEMIRGLLCLTAALTPAIALCSYVLFDEWSDRHSYEQFKRKHQGVK